jgi:hypothetical protein
VRKRYFGRELHEESRDSILRAVQLGSELETGADVLEHTRVIARFADEHDRDFEYQTRGGNATVREPKWNELPFITMMVQDETTTVHVDAWVREGADIPPAGFSFTEDEAGGRAHTYAREQLAAGHDAVLREGVRVQIPKAPKMLSEASGGNSIEAEEIVLRAGDPIAVELELETETETIKRTFAARPLPPKEYGHVAFASRDGDVSIELDFQALEEPTVRFSFNLTGHFGDDVTASLEAARLLHAFFTHKRSIVRAEGLFPGGELEGQFSPATDSGEREAVAGRLAVYKDLAVIEGRAGVDFVLPEQFGGDELALIHMVAEVIKTGGGTVTFNNASGIVEADKIASLSDTSPDQRIVRQPVTYEILGQHIDLGVGEFQLPAVQVIDVKPLGMTPDSPAHVTIGPVGTNQMHFRLVGSALRAA